MSKIDEYCIFIVVRANCGVPAKCSKIKFDLLC